MKIIKNTTAYVLCLMVAVSMMPVFAFATEQDSSGQIEQPQTVTEEMAPEVTEQQSPAVTDEQPQTPTPAQTPEASVADTGWLTLGEFSDSGSSYTQDSAYYNPTMRIYGIYLGGGTSGDAVLIESNGKYLLMDTGSGNSASQSDVMLLNALRNIGVKELDVYISHFHGDHFGGLEVIANSKQNEKKEFKINNVFVPDIALCSEYETPDAKKSIDQIYKEQTTIAKDAGAKVVYLRPADRGSSTRISNVYSQFSVGGASCSVIGPIGTHHLGEFSKNLHYLNNTSLCTIVQCGSFRFMTCGDLQTTEDAVITNHYGYGLNCDMMKLGHHGLSNSNSDYFLSRVSPMWSFAENHGYGSSSTKQSFDRAGRYGFVYAVASHGRNYIADVQYNAVRLFIDHNNNGRIDEGPITGWLKCGGGYQYYNGAGYIHTGWSWLNSAAYYMSGSSGFRLTGTQRINGVKVKFSSSGKLTSHAKPSKVRNRSSSAYKSHKIKIRWRKASRASYYQVFRATSKNGTYVHIANLSGKARSFKDRGLVPKHKYYYKVRAVRNVAGAQLIGSYSSIKRVKAR